MVPISDHFNQIFPVDELHMDVVKTITISSIYLSNSLMSGAKVSIFTDCYPTLLRSSKSWGLYSLLAGVRYLAVIWEIKTNPEALIPPILPVTCARTAHAAHTSLHSHQRLQPGPDVLGTAFRPGQWDERFRF